MKEIRLHGRGGAGVVMASKILARAFLKEGNHATSMPSFGPERRGAPVAASIRIDESPIREKTHVYFPDCLIVMDSDLMSLPVIYQGLKPDCILLLNTTEPPEKTPDKNIRVIGIIDATGIALEEMGVPITNTCMLGAFASATNWLSLDSVLSSMEKSFAGEGLRMNAKSARRGCEEVRVMKY